MVPESLNPADYDVYPHVAVVDEFRMTNADGSFAAEVNARFITNLVARLREREATTGDLSPIVIGHTKTGENENNGPQLVGYGRNWVQDAFFDTGRTAAFCDFWVRKVNRVVVDGVELTLSSREVVERWPRRSGEVWPETYDLDPISILGATTPARDLGPVMRLNRGGSITFFSPDTTLTSPGVQPVPDVPNPTAAADATAAVGNLPILQEILGLLKQLAANPAATPAAPATPAAGQPDAGDDGLSDEELEALLSGGDEGASIDAGEEDPEGKSRKGQPVVQNDGFGYAGGANTHVANPVRLSRVEAEVAQLRTQNAKLQLSRDLAKYRDQGIDIDPDDEALLADLASMPADMRTRQLERVVKLARRAPVRDTFGLSRALLDATSEPGTGKRVQTADDSASIIRLARQKGIAYDAAARELGFQIGN